MDGRGFKKHIQIGVFLIIVQIGIDRFQICIDVFELLEAELLAGEIAGPKNVLNRSFLAGRNRRLRNFQAGLMACAGRIL